MTSYETLPTNFLCSLEVLLTSTPVRRLRLASRPGSPRALLMKLNVGGGESLEYFDHVLDKKLISAEPMHSAFSASQLRERSLSEWNGVQVQTKLVFSYVAKYFAS